MKEYYSKYMSGSAVDAALIRVLKLTKNQKY